MVVAEEEEEEEEEEEDVVVVVVAWISTTGRLLGNGRGTPGAEGEERSRTGDDRLG